MKLFSKKKVKPRIGSALNPRKIGEWDFTGNFNPYKDGTPRRAINDCFVVFFGNEYFRIDNTEKSLSIRFRYDEYNKVDLINMTDNVFEEYIKDKVEEK